jgi:hypothetical protein
MPEFTLYFSGLNEALVTLKNYPKEVQQEVKAEILASVQTISAKQKRLAPKDQGGLVLSMGFDSEESTTAVNYTLFANSEHAAYLEFGTKSKVNVPLELQQIAQQAMGPGLSSSLTAKQAIFAWVDRLGLGEKAKYPIYIEIIKRGISPYSPFGRTPFFFQPFFDERGKLLQRITVILNESRTSDT